MRPLGRRRRRRQGGIRPMGGVLAFDGMTMRDGRGGGRGSGVVVGGDAASDPATATTATADAAKAADFADEFFAERQILGLVQTAHQEKIATNQGEKNGGGGRRSRRHAGIWRQQTTDSSDSSASTGGTFELLR